MCGHVLAAGARDQHAFDVTVCSRLCSLFSFASVKKTRRERVQLCEGERPQRPPSMSKHALVCTPQRVSRTEMCTLPLHDPLLCAAPSSPLQQQLSRLLDSAPAVACATRTPLPLRAYKNALRTRYHACAPPATMLRPLTVDLCTAPQLCCAEQHCAVCAPLSHSAASAYSHVMSKVVNI
jgi:hypothetical protein